MSDWLTPRQVVAELDRYVVGQEKAKRAVAVALRNRWRRLHAPDEIREDILPNNILMIGPTGVGKTEIARRLARLAGAPFVKVEASKFTEVGYVGRDVESMVRDLCDSAVSMVRAAKSRELVPRAEENAEERLLDLLLPGGLGARPERSGAGEGDDTVRGRIPTPGEAEAAAPAPAGSGTREKLRRLLREGLLDEREVEVEIRPRRGPLLEVLGGGGMGELETGLAQALGGLFPAGSRTRRMKVREAKRLVAEDEAEKLVDMDRVVEEALDRVQHAGIIFIDEIDKIATQGPRSGPDVSREGVQRDLLPLVEGSTVPTKYGLVRTDHILFIAAGAFHGCRPADLIPELQGRFPIRVELDSLGAPEFVRILTEPRNSLVRQYTALLGTEDVKILFHPEAIEEIAATAAEVNRRDENIGARRLHTIMTALLEDLLFESPGGAGREVVITRALVEERLGAILRSEDLSRYIL